MDIIKPSRKLNIDEVTLAQPKPLRGGSYFTKILNNGKPLYIQLSSCKTKQGIVETGKKIYTDLMFSSENQQDVEFIDWIEHIETMCHKLIFQKKDIWFHDNEHLDITDIEGVFSSPLRLYRSGRYYLLRVKINKGYQNKQTCMVYDENETILTLKDIKKDSSIVTLLCFEGIRFSSRSFQLDISLKQVMVMEDRDTSFLDNCMIKINKNNSKENVVSENVSENISREVSSKDLEEKSKHVDISEAPLEEKNNQEEEIQDNVSVEDNIQQCLDNIINIVVEDEKNTEEQQHVEQQHVEQQHVEQQHVDEENVKSTNNENNELEEVEINLEEIKDNISLKEPNEVYIEIYKVAKEKAKQARKHAIETYLEAQNIKNTYMLHDLDSSDDDEELNFDISPTHSQ